MGKGHTLNIHVVGILSATILLVFLVLSGLSFPTVQAEDMSGELMADVDASPNRISLSFNTSAATLRLAPTTDGADFKTTSITAMVTTLNPTGYTLSLGDTDGNLDLTNPSNSEYKIRNLTANVSISELSNANFPVNSYGYSLNGVDFRSMPSDLVTIKTTTVATNVAGGSPNTAIIIGAKADTSLPLGNYTNTITVRAVTNYNPNAKTFASITTMQEMEPYVCGDETTPAAKVGNDINTNVPTRTLIDARDNKPYTIAKLADGNCWMLEDLALDAGTLTAEKSDVTSDFILPAAENGTAAAPLVWSESLPHFANVNGGYYYNWYAATAGTGHASDYSTDTRISGGTGPANASASICPKGWSLPQNEVASGMSFRGLLAAYGLLNTSISDQKFLWSGTSVISTLTTAPFTLRIDGYYDQDAGYVRKAGVYNQGNYVQQDGTNPEGHYISATASGNVGGEFEFMLYDFKEYSFPRTSFTNANDTSYNPKNYGYAYPQHVGNKNDGYKVRCVVKGES